MLIPLRADILKYISTEGAGGYFTESETAELAALLGGRIYFSVGLDVLLNRSLTVAIIAALASLYPAWQASRLQPVEALRYE